MYINLGGILNFKQVCFVVVSPYLQETLGKKSILELGTAYNSIFLGKDKAFNKDMWNECMYMHWVGKPLFVILILVYKMQFK